MTVLHYLFENPFSTLCLFVFVSIWLSMLAHGVKRTGEVLGTFTAAFLAGIDDYEKKSRKRPPS